VGASPAGLERDDETVRRSCWNWCCAGSVLLLTGHLRLTGPTGIVSPASPAAGGSVRWRDWRIRRSRLTSIGSWARARADRSTRSEPGSTRARQANSSRTAAPCPRVLHHCRLETQELPLALGQSAAGSHRPPTHGWPRHHNPPALRPATVRGNHIGVIRGCGTRRRGPGVGADRLHSRSLEGSSVPARARGRTYPRNPAE